MIFIIPNVKLEGV